MKLEVRNVTKNKKRRLTCANPHSVMRLYYEPSKMSIGGLKKCL